MSTRLIITALSTLALTSLGLAQVEPAPATASTSSTSSAPVSAIREKETLSVDFPDEDIKTILRNVADLFELNLVVPDTLQGKTSIKLRDVSWRQIFSVVLKPVNFSYIENGNIIEIVSNDSLQAEPTSTDVFVLNYAKASDIKPTVDGMIDAAAGGKILVDARSNALVVTERPSRMGRVRNIIEQLDRATEQVMIESKFVEVTDRDVRNLGVNWSSLANYSVSGGPTTQTYTDDNSRTITTSRDLLTGLITDSVVDDTSTLGRIKSSVFRADQFTVILSALKSLNSVKVVSNPTVVTLNNTEALLNIGEEYPIPNYTYNQEQASFEVSGFNYKPIGIILKATPQVNARGAIKMSLEPEVSQRNGDAEFKGAFIPIIATRKVKTQVSLQSGSTVGIGGLIGQTRTNGKSKVPVLGDIPGLGKLFSSKTVSDQTSNLLIFITASTVSADGAKPEEVFDPRAVKGAGVTKDDVPGMRVQKGEELFAPTSSETPDAW
jgi:type IV pilus assembly protein PilQ